MPTITKVYPRVNVDKMHVTKIIGEAEGVETFDTPKYLPGVKSIGLKIKMNVEPFYAEGVEWDSDEALEGIDVEVDITDLADEDEAYLLGHTLAANGGVIYRDTDKAPEVALLFRARKSNKKNRYMILFRGKFTAGDEDYQGKEGKSNYQTKKLVGRFSPLKSNGMWRHKWDEEKGATDAFFTAVTIPTDKPAV